MIPRIQMVGVTGIGEVRQGDSLGDTIVAAALTQETPIESGDVLVVSQKIVSKAEGRLVDLRTVEPSPFASRFAAASGRDPRVVELVLRESRAVVRLDPGRGIIITETRHGFVCANAGIDSSNVPGDETVAMLPLDPDGSATRIREQVYGAPPGVDVAVIISDTFGRAWREGHVDHAIGVSGIEPFIDYRGDLDAVGKVLKVTRVAIADELAAAAELAMGKLGRVPAVLIKGCRYDGGNEGIGALIRPAERDMFR